MRTIHIFRRNNNVDIISTLPDDLCSLIVSFLPTKEAVATSVLSKRWRYVFASSPYLNFDYSLFPKSRGRKKIFTNFVETTLQHFQGPELRKFRLFLEDYEGYEIPLEEWVGFAVDNEVQDLEISLPRGRLTKIPDTVFKCASLTDLKLSVGNYAFELPLPVGLDRLKSLEIKSASLLKGEFIKSIFESCLLLEELNIEDCRVDVLEIESQRLKKLTICRCSWVGEVQIRVSAPYLRCFTYDGAIADNHHFEHMEFLVEASLNLVAPDTIDSDDEYSSSLLQIFRMFGNAKVLSLSPWCIEQLSRVPNLPRVNVKELELLLGRREDFIKVMTPLLVSCSSLKHLSVYILPSQSRRRGTSRRGIGQRQPNIKGAMKQMKTVALEYIDESDNGLKLVKFLLKNAPVLEKMKIIPSNDGLEQVKFRRKVSMFQKTSEYASVEYCSTA